jgi:pSer/pThr/pTyr-binding forkhead associated (FHA) protein
MEYPGTTPVLVVRHTGQTFPLTQAPVTIGRQPSSAIVLSDPQASPQHAMITFLSGKYVIQDMGSAGGTFVNERRITAGRTLRDGDVIRLGNTVFDVQLGPATEAAMPASELIPPAEQIALPPRASGASTGRSPVLLGLVVALAVLVVAFVVVLVLLLGRCAAPPAVTAEPPLVYSPTAVGQVAATLTPSSTPVQPAHATLPPTFPPTLEPATATPEATALPPTATSLPTETFTPIPTPTRTATATPTATGFPLPVIEFFRANPTTIAAGQCTTLEWGKVSNATQATIDQGIGGVGTPGSQQVCPLQTTTYVLTATGPGGVVTAKATVTVQALVDVPYPYDDIWQALGGPLGTLGVPVGQAVQRVYAGQEFENGTMFWQDNAGVGANVIYVIEWGSGGNQSAGDRWLGRDDTWQAGVDPTYSCPQAIPPNGPINGFGKLWCTRSNVRALLGAPLQPEVGDDGGWQDFANGLMLWDRHNNRVYVLFDQGNWQVSAP